MRQATSISRDDLVTFGVCLGKFTKTRRFRLAVTALDVLSAHALYRVWVKPSSEMAFLYGNHVAKAGVARMTEGVPQYGGVVVVSSSDVPLGFGRAAQTTDRCRDLDPTAVAVLHQADVGEYLHEDNEVA
jgi:60S ribosome subunit biogenesis protein NIP7